MKVPSIKFCGNPSIGSRANTCGPQTDMQTDIQTPTHGHDEANSYSCDYAKAPKSLYNKINVLLSSPNMVTVVIMSISWICSTHWENVRCIKYVGTKIVKAIDYLQELKLDGWARGNEVG